MSKESSSSSSLCCYITASWERKDSNFAHQRNSCLSRPIFTKVLLNPYQPYYLYYCTNVLSNFMSSWSFIICKERNWFNIVLLYSDQSMPILLYEEAYKWRRTISGRGVQSFIVFCPKRERLFIKILHRDTLFKLHLKNPDTYHTPCPSHCYYA